MKAKLLRMEGQSAELYEMLCMDGTKKILRAKELASFFKNFRDDMYLSGGEDGRWDATAMDMSEVGGDLIAYVVEIPREPDKQQLIVVDPGPFAALFVPDNNEDNELIPISEYAAMYGVTREIVKVYCRTGRIVGAIKAGGNWVVPRGAAYPTDTRCRAVNRKVKTPKLKTDMKSEGVKSACMKAEINPAVVGSVDKTAGLNTTIKMPVSK